MLNAIFHRFIPASLYGGPSAFPVLSKIDDALRQCPSADAAASVIEKSKKGLYTGLRERFAPNVAQALTLKILNICLARYHFHARSASVFSRPFGLIVDPSNMCQLGCPGCVHSARSEGLKVFDWRKGTLSEDRFSALLKLYGPYAIGIYFCNYGEPLLNLNTPRLIRQAKNYLMGTALSTSLSVQRFDPDSYVESGLDFMVLSVDGATQATYERFRRNGDLELVLDNIRRLVDARRRYGKHTPVLSWNFLAFEHNAHEIPLAARMARKLGVDQFRVVEPFDVRWDDPDMWPAAVKAGVRRLEWFSGTDLAENWNAFPESVEADTIARAYDTAWKGEAAPGTAPNAGHTCHWLYKNMVMDATGRILPCCGAPRPDANLVFGILDSSGADPFNSEKYRQARSFFTGVIAASGDAPYCAQCEWDQTTVNIGGPEIRRYFRAADAGFFDRRSLAMLSDW
jgi:MoaA/NifB/PqqE/SkfB family radical SAM enzyme